MLTIIVAIDVFFSFAAFPLPRPPLDPLPPREPFPLLLTGDEVILSSLSLLLLPKSTLRDLGLVERGLVNAFKIYDRFIVEQQLKI